MEGRPVCGSGGGDYARLCRTECRRSRLADEASVRGGCSARHLNACTRPTSFRQRIYRSGTNLDRLHDVLPRGDERRCNRQACLDRCRKRASAKRLPLKRTEAMRSSPSMQACQPISSTAAHLRIGQSARFEFWPAAWGRRGMLAQPRRAAGFSLSPRFVARVNKPRRPLRRRVESMICKRR